MNAADYLEYAALKISRMEDGYKILIEELLHEVFKNEEDGEKAILFFRESHHQFREFCEIPRLEDFKKKIEYPARF
jgi:hypothetical protein